MIATRKRLSAPRSDEDLAVRLFTSAASILLRLGIDAPKAERLMREAFVAAAIESARASSRRATQTRIASIAGISRLDVRKILTAQHSMSERDNNHRRTRIERLLEGWRSDPQFQNNRGKPRALVLSGAKSEFALLVRKYGRDVTARVLLEQLLRLRIAKERSGKIALSSDANKAALRSSAAQSDLRFLAGQLGEFNWREGRRTFSTAKIAISVGEKKTAHLVRRIALERIETVLKSIGALRVQAELTTAPARNTKNRVLVTASIAADVEDSVQ